jgi:hypothetical protein
MLAADTADQSCEEQQRMIDRVLVHFEKNLLPAHPGVAARRFILRCNSCSAWLQPL